MLRRATSEPGQRAHDERIRQRVGPGHGRAGWAMTRRASLPGAAELFRATTAAAAREAEVAHHPGVGAVPHPDEDESQPAPAADRDRDRDAEADPPRATPVVARPARGGRRIRAVGDRAPAPARRARPRRRPRPDHSRGRRCRPRRPRVEGRLVDPGPSAARGVNLSAEDAVAIESLAIEPLGGGGEQLGADSSVGFHVRLDNFEGPFDLLLSLISRRQMDVTEVALSQVTDEFLAHLTASGEWDLGQATEFLVVASTLLDLKAARLLPAADIEDEEDLALLEARDLLFARLLQYRAYKLAAAYLGELDRTQSRRHGRALELEPRFAQLLPDVLIGVTPGRFAAIAAEAMRPKPAPVLTIDHIHAPQVSVREHMLIIRERVLRHGSATFRD